LQQNSIDGAGRPEKLWHYPALGLFCLVIKRGFPIRRMFMQYHAKVIDPVKHRSHCLLVGCYQDGTLLQDAAEVDKAGAGQLQQLIKREKFQGKSGAGGTWESVKHAVRDAWDRITGQHDVDTDKMAEFEEDRISRERTF
jgi:hypothetical protein